MTLGARSRECGNEPRDPLKGNRKGWFVRVMPSIPAEHQQVKLWVFQRTAVLAFGSRVGQNESLPGQPIFGFFPMSDPRADAYWAFNFGVRGLGSSIVAG